MAQVLIIEDDELIAALERDFFKNSNFDVTVARDAKSGMKALSQTAVDAVILDEITKKKARVIKRSELDL